ncbi:MAG: zinc-ribbon domain-containing protein [Candidatus Accumulibacter sp.]|nr:zinc-ribbon domain-containing protein [Accumulibacter sp.]
MYCNQCGTPQEPAAKFCPACGHKLGTPNNQNSEQRIIISYSTP